MIIHKEGYSAEEYRYIYSIFECNKNDRSSEIEDKKEKIKMMLKGRTRKYTSAQIQENESKRRDMLVMEMLEKNNKPFRKDGYVVEQNRDRIERLMDDYNIPFEEALTP